MRYIGVDLHLRLLVICVIEVRDGARRHRTRALDESPNRSDGRFFGAAAPFRIVMEATATYDGFAELC